MKVYIVIGGWDYEGQNNLKVFKTREGAEVYADEMKRRDSYTNVRYDFVEIEEHVVEVG